MKLLSILAISLMGQAFANCPDLAGSYSCTSDLEPNKIQRIDVLQSDLDGITSYEISSPGKDQVFEVIADGKNHTTQLPSNPLGIGQATLATSCVNNDVIANGTISLGDFQTILNQTDNGLNIQMNVDIFIDVLSTNIACTLD